MIVKQDTTQEIIAEREVSPTSAFSMSSDDLESDVKIY